MKGFIKSYHVFVPQTGLKLFLYLLYPGVLIWLGHVLVDRGVPVQMCLIMAGTVVVTVEIFLDSMVFGGIASRDTNKLEYFKTSVRGMKVLRNSIIGDALRRAVSTALILSGIYLAGTTGVLLMQMLSSILVTLGCVELGLMITRSFTMMIVMLFTMIVMGSLCTYVMGYLLSNASIWLLTAALVSYLTATISGRIIIMKKARGSYYDERD